MKQRPGISFEKARDLENSGRVRTQGEEFLQDGIDWVFHPYRSGARGILRNIAAAEESTIQIHQRDAVDLVHARSYLAGAVSESH